MQGPSRRSNPSANPTTNPTGNSTADLTANPTANAAANPTALTVRMVGRGRDHVATVLLDRGMPPRKIQRAAAADHPGLPRHPRQPDEHRGQGRRPCRHRHRDRRLPFLGCSKRGPQTSGRAVLDRRRTRHREQDPPNHKGLAVNPASPAIDRQRRSMTSTVQ